MYQKILALVLALGLGAAGFVTPQKVSAADCGPAMNPGETRKIPAGCVVIGPVEVSESQNGSWIAIFDGTSGVSNMATGGDVAFWARTTEWGAGVSSEPPQDIARRDLISGCGNPLGCSLVRLWRPPFESPELIDSYETTILVEKGPDPIWVSTTEVTILKAAGFGWTLNQLNVPYEFDTANWESFYFEPFDVANQKFAYVDKASGWSPDGDGIWRRDPMRFIFLPLGLRARNYPLETCSTRHLVPAGFYRIPSGCTLSADVRVGWSVGPWLLLPDDDPDTKMVVGFNQVGYAWLEWGGDLSNLPAEQVAKELPNPIIKYWP